MHVRGGAAFQNVFTVLKILLIAAFVVGGLLRSGGEVSWSRGPDVLPLGRAVASPAFAVGLIFVAFAYSGFNGAAYIAGEVRRPGRNLPLALVAGTGIVTLLYLGLNAVILASAPASELAGRVEVGQVAAVRLFGDAAGRLVSGLIALALVSSVSAMVLVGPRVYEAMGRDYARLRILGRRGPRGGPVVAVVLQAVLAIGMLVSASFDALLTYIGFTLSLSAALTVSGVFVLRRRRPEAAGVRTWVTPAAALVFIGFSLWMVLNGLVQRPWEALAGGATVLVGLGLYAIVRALDRSGARPRSGPAAGP